MSTASFPADFPIAALRSFHSSVSSTPSTSPTHHASRCGGKTGSSHHHTREPRHLVWASAHDNASTVPWIHYHTPRTIRAPYAHTRRTTTHIRRTIFFFFLTFCLLGFLAHSLNLQLQSLSLSADTCSQRSSSQEPQNRSLYSCTSVNFVISPHRVRRI